MSAEDENNVKLHIQELLNGHHSSIGLEIDGELQGTRKNDQYIYNYIPKGRANHGETFRLIFEEKIDMLVDTDKSIEEKFVTVDNICLPWTRASGGSLPVGWTFHIKASDITDEDTMIEVHRDDSSDCLKILATVQEVDIVAYGSDNKMLEIKLDERPPVAISLFTVVKNLD